MEQIERMGLCVLRRNVEIKREIVNSGNYIRDKIKKEHNRGEVKRWSYVRTVSDPTNR